MRKSILLAFIVAFSTLFVSAQEYIPLAEEGTQWIIRFDKIESIQPVDGLWEYYATGDTTLNGNTYLKVFKRDLEVIQDGPPFVADGSYELHGLIRDDVAERKVYAIKFNSFEGCSENEEYLLFDFSLSEGDTLDLCLIPE